MGSKTAVRGQVRALGWRDGSSGMFSGTIEGLYQGYRFGAAPDERAHLLELPYGTLAVTVRQRTDMRLPERPADHPFAGDADPIKGIRAQMAALPVEDRPVRPEGPPETPTMTVEVLIDPHGSTGIFAGATGVAVVDAPNYEVAGTLRIETSTGDLWMDFLEAGAGAVLEGRASVDGTRSTGAWRNATGHLDVRFELDFPNIAEGTYSGTIELDSAPAS